MKVIFEDFVFEGKHIEQYICELPQVKEFDETVQERLIEYIVENLKQLNS